VAWLDSFVIATLYHATNGANWTKGGDDWTSMTQTKLCKWGYSDRPLCRLGILNRLLLAAKNLVGRLPSEIGLLTRLDTIGLSHNQRTGLHPAKLLLRDDVERGEHERMTPSDLQATLPEEYMLFTPKKFKERGSFRRSQQV
jgi:hypothetical protein